MIKQQKYKNYLLEQTLLATPMYIRIKNKVHLTVASVYSIRKKPESGHDS